MKQLFFDKMSNKPYAPLTSLGFAAFLVMLAGLLLLLAKWSGKWPGFF